MANIDLDQELVDFLRANESLTGDTASEFIRKLLQKRRTKPEASPRIRNENSDLAVFLRILREVHHQHPERFSKVEGVRGRTRIYFSKDPKTIEASGRSTFPVEISETGWWVTSNTSTDHKRRMLEDVFAAVGCPAGDRNRWLGEFAGSEPASDESQESPEEDDPFKI